MHKVIKIFLFLIFFATAAAGAVYFFAPDFFYGLRLEKTPEKILIDVSRVAKEVITPPPLRSEKISSQPSDFLTKAGIVDWTNNFRRENNLPLLKENSFLNRAAEMKLNNMLLEQYFAHVSPSGNGPVFWIDKVGYDYIAFGENLALGDFSGDKDLVSAWMDSPGHRANILSLKFREIGVSVRRSVFEGKETWLAVQEFGTPISVCPQPDENLKAKIQTSQERLNQMGGQMEALRSEIESFSSKRRAEYNQIVQQFNALVTDYNNSVVQIKTWVTEYNSQIRDFNSCAGSN